MPRNQLVLVVGGADVLVDTAMCTAFISNSYYMACACGRPRGPGPPELSNADSDMALRLPHAYTGRDCLGYQGKVVTWASLHAAILQWSYRMLQG